MQAPVVGILTVGRPLSSKKIIDFLRRLNNLLVSAFVISSVAFLPGAGFAAPKTTIISVNTVINFGSFSVLPSCANCTITISPLGARTASGGVVLTTSNPGSAATYSVTAPGSGVSYTAVFTPTSATMAAGGVTMTVGSFTTLQNPSNGTPNTLSVGATLTIPNSGSTAGTYTGAAFTITTSP
ncbi:DUF4402 domain-containing protein [Polaromonas sp. JS666]|uniref:DUF4402 domain-containing protein n=1 Tax=Polaromonas sp. (strain JS666 / ATCC BAA-500) TaxID=296591 RepID=UPI0003239599|nr:DUF4402 domain-containing protein [Polaromonas sp. JS666]